MIDFNNTIRETFLKLIQNRKAWLLILATLFISNDSITTAWVEISAGLIALWVMIIMYLRK